MKARDLSTPRFSLLTPFLLAARNRFLPAGRPSFRALGIVLFSAAVATGLYLIARRVLGYFHAQSELGIILSLKIFEMTWIVLFAMVLFSCMVAAVSTLFLSKDNEILFAAPVSPARLFAMRYTTTSLYAGWMLFLFMLPVLLAYGQVFAAGPGYWLLLPLALLATILTATGGGDAVDHYPRQSLSRPAYKGYRALSLGLLRDPDLPDVPPAAPGRAG